MPADDAQRPEPAAPNWALLKFTPPAAAALALATIGSCYSLAKQHGHLPPGATTPPISLFGVRNPEYRLYAVGMSAVSALFCTMAAPLHRWLSHAAAPQLQDDVTPITLSAVVAFGGLAVHGVVPLQEDIVEIIGGRRAEINSGTQVHQMAASVFFMCALPSRPHSLFLSGGVEMRRCSLYHGWQMIQLQCSPHAAPLPISWARAPSSVLFKVRPLSLCPRLCWLPSPGALQGFGLGLGLLPLFGSMVYHPAVQGSESGSSLDLAGQMQYGVVAGIILMCATPHFRPAASGLSGWAPGPQVRGVQLRLLAARARRTAPRRRGRGEEERLSARDRVLASVKTLSANDRNSEASIS